MAAVNSKRSVMTLYTSPSDTDCHRVRMVLAQKGIAFEVVEVDPANPPEDLLDINPYNTLPTLVDRDLVLYNADIIVEYLDERFPHPPLLPVDPVSRAKSRLVLYRLQNDWYSLLPDLESGDEARVAPARKILSESLVASSDVFSAQKFFLNEDFSIMDCTVAPVLWRLPKFGIELPAAAKPVQAYMDRVFALESFQQSLTETEREIRE